MKPITKTGPLTSVPPEKEIGDLPMIGGQRARALCAARPFKSWQDVERVPGIGAGIIDDLKSGGAHIGAPG